MSDATEAKRAQDYAFLRKEGLRHIRELAGKVWTDFNLHDPGVTILELLCYAITDLGYRAAFDVKDILADESAVSERSSRAMYTAGEILPTAPVTNMDYVKLLLDVEGVAGARLEESQLDPVYFDPAHNTLSTEAVAGAVAFRPRGVFDVLLTTAEGADSGAVCKQVSERLKCTRSLCQDFGQIVSVPVQEFIVCAEIELETEADKNLVAARIYHELGNYLSPRPRFYSLHEMLARGKTTAEIFDGPILEHGFLDEAELEKAQLRQEIALSDVMAIMRAVEGVHAIREAIVTPHEGPCDVTGNQWTVCVEPRHQARLRWSNSRIVFYKGVVPGLPDAAAVTQAIKDLEEQERKTRAMKRREDLPAPSGVPRDIADYEPVHNHLPRAYGVGEAGLPDSAPAWRHARARQLKSYLSFYDRILAGYFAQLSRVADMFSASPAIKQTYFAGRLADHVKTVCGADNDAARRNRFLDHLLARFAEAFNQYVWTRYLAEDNQDETPLLETAANRKISFLRNYVEIGYGRFLGVCNGEGDEFGGLSGFERRVGHLLGIPNGRNYRIVSRTENGAAIFSFEIHNDDDDITMRSGDFTTREAAAEHLRKTIRFAGDAEQYRRQAQGGQYAFRVIDENGDTLATGPWFDTKDEREQAIGRFCAFMGRGRFYVVEHILLRPRPGEGGALLRSCPGEGGEIPIDAYSYRLTVVASGDTDHFIDLSRRRFAESVIRNETPAHIMPRVCWVSDKQMAKFEDVYRNWLKSETAGRENLVKTLCALHSMYAQAWLGEGETKKVVILDQTMLGSKEPIP